MHPLPLTVSSLACTSSQGISAKNVTLGVPRLNEILNVAKMIKTPSVTINIRKADDEEEASDLISQVRNAGYSCINSVGLGESHD